MRRPMPAQFPHRSKRTFARGEVLARIAQHVGIPEHLLVAEVELSDAMCAGVLKSCASGQYTIFAPDIADERRNPRPRTKPERTACPFHPSFPMQRA